MWAPQRPPLSMLILMSRLWQHWRMLNRKVPKTWLSLCYATHSSSSEQQTLGDLLTHLLWLKNSFSTVLFGFRVTNRVLLKLRRSWLNAEWTCFLSALQRLQKRTITPPRTFFSLLFGEYVTLFSGKYLLLDLFVPFAHKAPLGVSVIIYQQGFYGMGWLTPCPAPNL